MATEATTVEIAGDVEAVYEEYVERGWCDGLPIVPPTPERVERMLAAGGRDPDEVVAILPPRQAPATVRVLATNAVMAGCRPEYFPVVLTAVEAIATEEFDIFSVNSTTNAVALLTVINGPVRERLKINCGYGLFGPGWRANATIGRALRLIQLNVCGSIPGEVSKSTHGQPGRYTMCFGEWEEESPWEPLHVELGMPVETSCVTMFQSQGTVPITETRCKEGASLIHFIAHCMDMVGTNNMLSAQYPGDSLLVLCPDHANIIARDGNSKQDVKEQLFKITSRVPIERWPKERRAGLEQQGKAKNGLVRLHNQPSQFRIVVAGGPGGFHSTWVPTYGHARATLRAIPGGPER